MSQNGASNSAEADIAGVAAAIGDPSRARVLLALAEGRALPASALAAEAGVSASTISEHLGKLLDATLLTVERDGRHRYYRLATPEVATTLEWLSRIAQPLPVRSLRQSTRAAALLRARLCYDHLAGRLGVAVMAALLERGWLVTEASGPAGGPERYLVSGSGRAELAAFGVDVSSVPPRRPSVRYCVDWAERRPHLAGPLGGALAARLFELGWVRRGRARRVVHLTEEGAAGMADSFGVRADWAS
ncbi:MAG TPA: metalloregulator ArsR/SmtB family transcription factor [Pseudonocardia sp.]|uniref:ArsR/SmtB family transcription factor n=1 Tax=Pseudonocardia sp. TaxID=60912 RepID=UPI002EDB4AB2